ncbi:MAG TPA: catalase family peroxidase [Limnobacter sp.]|uniref:catalase family peroxidase n=1 Tax=Limnobacter sp. TaxID=2003368 RepID=UPI002EDA3B88
MNNTILNCALGGLLLAAVTPAVHAQETNAVTLVDGLEGVFGKQDGFRRSGAKGVCAKGVFTGTPAGAALSSASAFSGKPVPVILRFSVGGGNPKAPENAKSVRGMAIQMDLPNNEQWLMANISTPVFGAATPESFQAFLDARRPDPATGKPDPAKIAAATAANPDHKIQPEFLKNRGVPASYGAVNYWGVNAFKMTNKKGQSQMVRWVFEPVGGEEFLKEENVATTPPNFLVDELKGRVGQIPVNFSMVVQLAAAGDPTNNPTVLWPADRKTVVAGNLAVMSVEDKTVCDGINFNPLVLPKGVAASDDPILLARPGAYAVSQSRRLSK